MMHVLFFALAAVVAVSAAAVTDLGTAEANNKEGLRLGNAGESRDAYRFVCNTSW